MRDSGRILQNTAAAISARPPITSIAVCQLTKSIKTPVIRRPHMPPMALPAMYNPIARPMCLGWISSLKYVIATAANPLNDSPTKARSSNTPCQVGIMALAIVHAEAANSAATITGLRPMRSEIGPVINRPMASRPVATDRIRLLCAALMEKFLGQQRHHRLHAIQQGKGRKATAEQRQHRAHEHRRALLDIDVLEFGDDIILHTRRDFMGQWSDSSFHGGPRKGTFWQAMKKSI
nr:hypothetical protein GCM10020185_26170 [Pseudomonas brassicacearum subsp. brassicacearum]